MVRSHCLGLLSNGGCGGRARDGDKLGNRWGGSYIQGRVVTNWYTLRYGVVVFFS